MNIEVVKCKCKINLTKIDKKNFYLNDLAVLNKLIFLIIYFKFLFSIKYFVKKTNKKTNKKNQKKHFEHSFSSISKKENLNFDFLKFDIFFPNLNKEFSFKKNCTQNSKNLILGRFIKLFW